METKIAGEAALREDAAVVIALFMPRGGYRSGNHRVEHPERVQHPQAVFPDIDPGAEDAQVAVLLVHPDPPALAREGKPGGEPGDSAAGDLDAPGHDANSSAPIRCISTTLRLEVRREDAKSPSRNHANGAMLKTGVISSATTRR